MHLVIVFDICYVVYHRKNCLIYVRCWIRYLHDNVQLFVLYISMLCINWSHLENVVHGCDVSEESLELDEQIETMGAASTRRSRSFKYSIQLRWPRYWWAENGCNRGQRGRSLLESVERLVVESRCLMKSVLVETFLWGIAYKISHYHSAWSEEKLRWGVYIWKT